MPVYTYSAKDVAGQTVSGQVIAPNERMAASQVRDLGYYPMQVSAGGLGAQGGSLQPPPSDYQTQQSFQGNSQSTTQTPPGVGVGPNSSTGTAFGQSIPLGNRRFLTDESALGTPFVRPYGSWFERSFIFPVWSGVSIQQLSLFFRQFSAMLGAGMTITGALSALGGESNSALRVAVHHMAKHVNAGGRLSEALAMFPHIFSPLQREMVAASENTGGLDAVMIQLSEYLEADAALRNMIKRETFMPKINFAATFLLPPLVVWVMQGAHAYFDTAVLPLLKIVGAMLAVYVSGRYALKAEAISISYDTVKAYLPYFGTTVRMLAIAKFARALSALYKSGVLIPTAVATASRTVGNAFMGWQMQKTVPAMMAGAGLTESFRQAGVFPPMFLSMLATGETTGALDTTLTKMAEFYEAESAVRLHQSVQTLNVLIFLLVAGMVGYEVVKFWTGYYGGIMGAAGDGS